MKNTTSGGTSAPSAGTVPNTSSGGQPGDVDVGAAEPGSPRAAPTTSSGISTDASSVPRSVEAYRAGPIRGGHAGRSAPDRGSVRVKVDPRPGSLSTVSLPPRSSA